ncbi:hypothetical protein [Pectobacterium sp. A5351]|uniref:hypothetical protein n=1 Tax=Pectobacterium sp. A5351 TaxID=2914983 RepID=UPI002330AF12|nr:hypothetical protein [Pectobacterium sp. A5351]WCG84177.1 hypothetical protein O1Q74_05850 [Pectobacterium sp. A5351]
MDDYAVGVRGHVHMWANTSAVIQFLPQDLASFLQTRPLIRINLEEKLSKTVVTALAMGKRISASSRTTSAHRASRRFLTVRTSWLFSFLLNIRFPHGQK